MVFSEFYNNFRLIDGAKTGWNKSKFVAGFKNHWFQVVGIGIVLVAAIGWVQNNLMDDIHTSQMQSDNMTLAYQFKQLVD